MGINCKLVLQTKHENINRHSTNTPENVSLGFVVELSGFCVDVVTGATSGSRAG